MKPGPSKGHGGRPRKKASEGPEHDISGGIPEMVDTRDKLARLREREQELLSVIREVREERDSLREERDEAIRTTAQTTEALKANNDERDRLREVLEIIANQGPGAVKAYNDPLRGVPATGDRMRLLARNALKETT